MRSRFVVAIFFAFLIGGVIFLLQRDKVNAHTELHNYCIAVLDNAPEGYRVVTREVDCLSWATTIMQRAEERVMNCQYLVWHDQSSYQQCFLGQDIIPPGMIRAE